MKFFCGIDPGEEISGFVKVDENRKVVGHIIAANSEIRNLLVATDEETTWGIEMPNPMGQCVGRTVFRTIFWVGRFYEKLRQEGNIVKLVERSALKYVITGATTSKDSNVVRAMKDLYGEKGTKKNPGNTYEITSHEWQALAVCEWLYRDALGYRGIQYKGD